MVMWIGTLMLTASLLPCTDGAVCLQGWETTPAPQVITVATEDQASCTLALNTLWVYAQRAGDHASVTPCEPRTVTVTE